MFLPCSGRTIQCSWRLSATRRSISWQPESVKSCPLPDFPRSKGAQSPAGRPLQTLAARRIVPPAHRLNDAAEQPYLQIAAQTRKSGPVDGHHAHRIERQHIHCGSSQFAVTDRSLDRLSARVRGPRAATRPQPRPLEARIDIRGVVQPLHAAREKRGGEPGARFAEQGTQQAHLRLIDQQPPCRQGRRDRSGGPPASPPSRPDRPRDGRAADAGCPAAGTRRATAGTGPSAPPPAGRSAACRPTR